MNYSLEKPSPAPETSLKIRPEIVEEFKNLCRCAVNQEVGMSFLWPATNEEPIYATKLVLIRDETLNFNTVMYKPMPNVKDISEVPEDWKLLSSPLVSCNLYDTDYVRSSGSSDEVFTSSIHSHPEQSYKNGYTVKEDRLYVENTDNFVQAKLMNTRISNNLGLNSDENAVLQFLSDARILVTLGSR